MHNVNTVVVGAGQAGLAVSAALARAGHDHVVLERGRVGDTWRTQRWDSFRLNTPNWMNGLPDGDGFGTAPELVAALERRARALPVREGVEVADVRRVRGGGFEVATWSGVLRARSVVAASGGQRVPSFPEIARALPARITQLHAAEYRSPDTLPRGAVLVVGGGQSGVQIAADLLAGGRDVLLATSRVGRVPRRYRGRDIFSWWRDMGRYDLPASAISERTRRRAQPQVAGLRTVSLQQLARDGAVLLGRLLGAGGGALRFSDEAAANVRHADEQSARHKGLVDEHIERHGIVAPPAEDDPVEAPLRHVESPLSVPAAGIGSVIWATGFRPDFRWIRMPILDATGTPMHVDGATRVPGLFVAGLPWLIRRASGTLWGMNGDGERIAAQVLATGRDRRSVPARRTRAA